MALLLTVVVIVCFFAALLPFLFPGAVVGLFGKILNDALGEPVWNLAPMARGILVTRAPDGAVLTREGVLAVYIPLLMALLLFQRYR